MLMLDSCVATRWRFKEFLDENNLSAYSVVQETSGKLSRTAVYDLASSDSPASIRISTFDALLPALEKLTGRRVEIGDLLTYERDN